MKDEKTEKPVEEQASLTTSRDAISGLTANQRADFEEFLYGQGYDHDPERRRFREMGGHCSGGGGPC